MEQVQNGRLYIRYRSNSQKNEAEEWKCFQTTSICYSFAKSSLKSLINFSKVEKTKHENFDFVHLLSSSFFFFLVSSFFFSIRHNSKTIRCLKILCIPNDCSANEDYSYLFWAVYELRLASSGLKTVSNTLRVLLRTLLNFSWNNCMGMARMVRPHTDYSGADPGKYNGGC